MESVIPCKEELLEAITRFINDGVAFSLSYSVEGDRTYAMLGFDDGRTLKLDKGNGANFCKFAAAYYSEADDVPHFGK